MKAENKKEFSLIPYLLKYKWHYFVGIIILLLVDLASLLIPQYTGEVIDGLTKGSFGFEGVKPLLIRIFLAGLTMMLGRFGWRFFIIGASRGLNTRCETICSATLRSCRRAFTTATRPAT